MMRSFPRTILVLVTLALCVIGLTAALAWAAQTHRISQKGRTFQVKGIEIRSGDTVQFTNDDMFFHQIYIRSTNLTFESDEQPPGEIIEVKFPTAGTYEVHCRIHPKMLVVVDVK
jgi:plastocyanin